MKNSRRHGNSKWQHDVLKLVAVVALFALALSMMPAHADPVQDVKAKINQLKRDAGDIKNGVNMLHAGMGLHHAIRPGYPGLGMS